jgi:hypothetical protein
MVGCNEGASLAVFAESWALWRQTRTGITLATELRALALMSRRLSVRHSRGLSARHGTVA